MMLHHVPPRQESTGSDYSRPTTGDGQSMVSGSVDEESSNVLSGGGGKCLQQFLT